ncbi:MAG: hypothetical protein KAS13_02930 [Candidatus Omnitrophica bacterium]|nr:hypothetical protein [Candidatus Omnitrophota bacterium]
MERIIVLALVFTSFGLLMWKMINLLKGKDSCSGCGSYKECVKKMSIGKSCYGKDK